MPDLTRIEAAERADLVAVDEYAIDLDLTTGPDTFDATTMLRLRCHRPGASTFVEIRPAVLHEATLNGRPLDPATLAGNRLPLPALAAQNTLVVRASMPYSNSGEGLHRFTDPADGREYLYAQTFLDDAQRIFACFDQPDLKTPISLAVTADPQWTIIANGAGHPTGPGRWRFDTTPPLSTYLMTLIAGAYHSIYSEHDGVPLGLHCRASLAPQLDREADELFTVTRQCLDRYHALFDVRYPFGKYDQAFVPEFNAGAMENPGCVTFRDEFVFRSAVTDAQREGRAVVIAHEMAHMWFGDLVTMRWWNDLWLNESFADYLGVRVAGEATRFTGTWVRFALARKTRGYAADQRPSTHPIAPEEVADTAAALLNFDGISYAKGAAVLRQLAAWLGDDDFFAGLRQYFATHRFGNATLADLLAALERASGRDLMEWSRLWLREARVNTLRPVVSVDDAGRYASVTIAQSGPALVQRPHRLALGCYERQPDDAVVLQTRVEVELDPSVDHGQTPVPELTGHPAAAVLLVNDGDLTYAKVRLLEGDLAGLSDVLPAVADPVARAGIWCAVWDATRDAELPATRFVDLVASALPAETDVGIFETTLDYARSVAVPQFLPGQAQPAALAKLAAACERTLGAAPAGSGRQLAAARGSAGCAGPDRTATLRDWLAGTGIPDGLAMDADLRWAVLYRLVVLGEAGAGDIDAEGERDRSAQGAEQAARCRAALPDPAAKAAAWQAVTGDSTRSNRLAVATAAGFWQPEQGELGRSYVERYFADMPELAARRTPQVFQQLAAAAYPQYAVAPVTLLLADRLLERDDLHPALRRTVVDRTDDLRRALAARERFA
jgi:aminopeptidase N